MMSTLRRKINISTYEEILICPILHERMTDPVIALDGQTYERRAITAWFEKGNRRSPVTGQSFGATILIDNDFARTILEDLIRAEPELDFQENPEDKADLEKCIQEKEEFIRDLLQKEDRINIERNASYDVETAHLIEKIEELTKLNSEIPANYLSQIDSLQQEIQRLLIQVNELKFNQININSDNNLIQNPSIQLNSIQNNTDYSKVPSIQTLTGHNTHVYSLMKVSDNVIASGSHDKTIKLWKFS